MAAGDLLPGWEHYVDMLRPIGERIPTTGWGMDEAMIQETWQQTFGALVQGYLDYVFSDPEYPDFKIAYDTSINLAAPVPDFRYKACLVDGAGTYRVSGFRGTSLFVDLTVFTSLYSLGKRGPVSTRISLDDLTLGDNGRFEVVLGPSRPDGWVGDFYELDSRAIRFQVRHASYDWVNEVDARMAIERLDRPARRPRPGHRELAARLSLLATWAENSVLFGIEHVQRQAAAGVVNRVEYFDYSSYGGFDPKIQTYCEGLYDLADDEALIVETEIPERTRYWSFLLSDPIFATIDWMNLQSSLNGHQATLDTDGRCRCVVAHHDPGVPNWLDTGGYLKGLLQVRWNEASSTPLPEAKVVKLSEVRNHLPADTPTVTPEERDGGLRVRREGAQLRSRW